MYKVRSVKSYPHRVSKEWPSWNCGGLNGTSYCLRIAFLDPREINQASDCQDECRKHDLHIHGIKATSCWENPWIALQMFKQVYRYKIGNYLFTLSLSRRVALPWLQITRCMRQLPHFSSSFLSFPLRPLGRHPFSIAVQKISILRFHSFKAEQTCHATWLQLPLLWPMTEYLPCPHACFYATLRLAKILRSRQRQDAVSDSVQAVEHS